MCFRQPPEALRGEETRLLLTPHGLHEQWCQSPSSGARCTGLGNCFSPACLASCSPLAASTKLTLEHLLRPLAPASSSTAGSTLLLEARGSSPSLEQAGPGPVATPRHTLPTPGPRGSRLLTPSGLFSSWASWLQLPPRETMMANCAGRLSPTRLLSLGPPPSEAGLAPGT